MTGAEMKIPTPEELEAMLARGELKRIGDGSRRICYAIGDSGLCLKGYRREQDLDSRMRPDGSLETHPLKSSTVREIRAARFDERKNTSCQEWRSYQELKAKLPQELFASFPETLERVLVPSFGWCLVENLIVNADGSPVQKFAPVYRNADESLKKRLLAVLLALRDGLMRHAVRFYDPQNVMVQFAADGSFRLRIIDFEPATRTWIPIDTLLPAITRRKCARRFRRFITESLHVKGAVE